MTIIATTHVNLRGTARAALELYQSVFGGDLAILTYADAHAVQQPDEANQVMWGQVAAPDGFRIMAYDVPASKGWDQGENSFFVSVRCSTADEVTARWEGLADGATVIEPLAAAPWSPLYGMLRDRFGIVWVMDVAVEYPAG